MNSSTKKEISIALNGLVLAGGRSSRMGQDKSLIQYYDVSQREYLFTMLGNFCTTVYTSFKSLKGIPAHLNPLQDRFDFEGPLNGILTAFSHDPHVAWLTVPVDMPLIDVEAISYLLSKRDTNKVATCFFDSDGKNPEPLVTIWEPKSYPLLLDFFKAGRVSPRDFLKHEKTNIIEIPDRRVLMNINNPEGLEKFRNLKK